LHTRRAPLPCSVCEVSLCLATSYVDLSEGPTFFHPYLRPKKVQENFSKERSPKSELVRQTWYFWNLAPNSKCVSHDKERFRKRWPTSRQKDATRLQQDCSTAVDTWNTRQSTDRIS
jgi:hypothetical protein